MLVGLPIHIQESKSYGWEVVTEESQNPGLFASSMDKTSFQFTVPLPPYLNRRV